MNQGAVLCCHSPALSYLLYESSCSNNDQRGLLLGSVKSHTISRITDDPALHEETKTIVYIEHSVPLPDEIFGSFGQMSEQSSNHWIRPYKDKLIGWYSSRRHYKASKPSLKDIVIHHRFLNWINQEDNGMFVYGSLATIAPYPQSTHSFHYAFHTFNKETCGFVEFPLKICNLSDRTFDSAGCLESCLYPEARNFRQLKLNAGSAGANIAEPLSNYLNDCTKKLKEMCDSLYKLETERLILENSVQRFRNLVNVNRPEPAALIRRPASPKRDQGDHMLSYDSTNDYSNGEMDQLVFDEDLDEKMDLDESEKGETPDPVTVSSPTVHQQPTELSVPEIGEEPSTEPENAQPVGNSGDGPAVQMPMPANDSRVSSGNITQGRDWENRNGSPKISGKKNKKPANSRS